MAYRRSSRSRSRSTARRGGYRAVRRSTRSRARRPARRATRRVSRARRKAAARPGRIVLVVQHQPMAPTLATPATKAPAVRARFTQ